MVSHVVRLLRQQRKEKKLLMNAVATTAGLSQQMVRYVEHGMRSSTLLTLLRIATALHVDLARVLARAQKAARRQAESG